MTFCRLLILFANSFDPEQDRQNVGPDVGPNLCHSDSFPERFFGKISFENKSQQKTTRARKIASMQSGNLIMHLRVKSGYFGHQVNSDIHLQTLEIQMRRLLTSRLISIFTVCLVFLNSNN